MSRFFPNVIQPPIAVLSQIVFDLLVRVKICKKPVRRYDVGAGPSSITITLPGIDAQDAERRRQKALKALNERLGRVESPTHWPSIADGEDEEQELMNAPSRSIVVGLVGDVGGKGERAPLLPVHQPRQSSPESPQSPESVVVHKGETSEGSP